MALNKEDKTMTIKEIIDQLNDLISQGVDPNTLVVTRYQNLGNDVDSDCIYDPDPDVECIYYDEEADRLCIEIE